MIKQEIYKSSTHGEIPLSFTGRHLLQNLRSAITKALAFNDYHTDDGAVAKARGELALYMNKLEQQGKEPSVEDALRDAADEELLLELSHRLEEKKDKIEGSTKITMVESYREFLRRRKER